MSFQYIPLNGRLTTSQENLLDRIENAASPYQGIKCLKDLRTLGCLSHCIKQSLPENNVEGLCRGD